MVNLRGGIQSFAIDGVFLHMLCTTNHLSAVLSESASLIPPSGPYKPRSPAATSPPYISPSSLSTATLSASPPTITSTTPLPPLEQSPLLKPFALQCGFNSTLVDVFHDIGYLYAVVDAFTRRLLPSLRKGFEDIVAEIESSSLDSVQADLGREILLPGHGLVGNFA